MTYREELLAEAAAYESNAASAKYDLALEMLRPFYKLRPKVFPDGNQWCVLYGENIQDGVCGFGDAPEKASEDFDITWLNQTVSMKGK